MDTLQLIKDKLIVSDDIPILKKKWKNNNSKVVFTNGCFDILHAGHIEYMAKASDLGDVFVLGLNTDKSVKENKGSDRPINDQFSRAFVLGALFFIDHIIMFSEKTPYNLIKEIRPNFLVKGKDYRINDVVGADIVLKGGGEVVTIELKKGYSTSKIIEKLESME